MSVLGLNTFVLTFAAVFNLSQISCGLRARFNHQTKIIAISNARLRFEFRTAEKRKAKTQKPPATKPPKPPAKIAYRPPQGHKRKIPQNAATRHPPKPPHTPPTRRQKPPPDMRPKLQNPPGQQKRLPPKKMRPRHKALAANHPPQDANYKAAKSDFAAVTAASNSATKELTNGASRSLLNTQLAP